MTRTSQRVSGNLTTAASLTPNVSFGAATVGGLRTDGFRTSKTPSRILPINDIIHVNDEISKTSPKHLCPLNDLLNV